MWTISASRCRIDTGQARRHWSAQSRVDTRTEWTAIVFGQLLLGFG